MQNKEGKKNKLTMEDSSNEPDGCFSGKSYELNLYLLFLHRGCRNNTYGFKLRREQKDAGKFDDLVFEFQENGATVYRLLQAKHSMSSEKRITKQMLFSGGDGDFDVIKYLVSYRTAKQNYSTKGQIKDFIICTSRSFDFKQLEIDIEKITEVDNILHIKNDEKESVKYRLKGTKQNFGKIKGEWKKRMNKWEKENDVRKAQPEPDEKEIKDYLNHLIFAVDMPNDTDLGIILKNEIGEEFNEMTRKDIYERAFRRMIDWMKANDRRNFWTHENAKAMFEDIKVGFTLPYDIRYNVQPPIKRFTGRTEQLEKLDQLLQKEKQAMICGFGGVGKTELVREYIKKHSDKYYNNILWIDAERAAKKDDAESNTEKDTALVNSFRNLASGKLKIETKDAHGEEKEISIIINEVYRWFQQSKSLFVFDNVEWHQYQDYIQPSLPENVRKPYIIVISRVKWQNEDLITRIDLSVFEESEAMDFISQSLPKFLENGRQGDSVKKLAETLQYFPLALRQATAYINVQFRFKTKTYQFSEYIENFAKKSEEYLDYRISKYCESKYSKTVWTTWNVTIEALQSEKNYTPDALNYMSFLLPNDIHEDLLLKLFKDKDKLETIILLLDEYSLITVRESLCSLHSLVQLVTREKLKPDEKREVLKCILEVIAENDEIIARGVDHFASAWTYFKQSCSEYVEEYYHIPATIAIILFDIGRYKEAYSLGIEALEFMKSFSFNDEKEKQYVQNIAQIIVRFLCNSGQYAMALNKSKEILTILKDINERFPCTEPILSIESDIVVISLRMRDFEAATDFLPVLTFKNVTGPGKYQNIIMFRKEIVADMWSCFFHYKSVLHVYCELFDEHMGSSKISDPDSLRISKKIAKTYYQAHLYEKAIKFSFKNNEKSDFVEDVLSFLQKAHEEQKKVLPNNHSDRLDTQECIIGLLIGQEKYKEALELFENLSDTRLARNNCSLLIKKATVLALLNKGDDAWTICECLKKDILKLQSSDFKKNYPDVVDRCVGVALVLSLLSKFDEALEILGEIWDRLKYSVSCYNIHIANILIIIGHVYLMQNKRVEGLSTFDELWLCYQNMFSLYYWNPEIPSIFIDLFLREGRVDSALWYGLQLINIYEQLPLGPPEESIWEFKRDTAKICFHKKYYEKALSMLTEVKNYLEAFREKYDSDYRETCEFITHINIKKKEEAESIKNKMSTIKNHFEAVKCGNLEVLKKCIKERVDVNAADENGWTLLHHAAKAGNQEITDYLLQSGADVTRVTRKWENTVLHIAVKGNHFDFIRLLLNFDYDKSKTIINVKTKISGTTALHVASKKGSLKMVRLLLDYGAAYDVKNQAGKSPLEMARGIVVEAVLREVHTRFQSFSTPTEYKALELFQNCSVTHLNAVFDARNSEGHSLLKLSVIKHRETLVNSFLDLYKVDDHLSRHIHYDAVLLLVNNDKTIQDLIRANRKSRVKYVEFVRTVTEKLSLKDIRCMCKNNFLSTIGDMLDILARDEVPGEVETLAMDVVEQKVNQIFQIVNSVALLDATRRDDLEAFELCLAKKPVLNTPDEDGRTALHHAASAGNVTMVERLLDGGINKNFNQLQRESPLHLAAKNGHIEVARILLRRISSISNRKTKGSGETALHLASKNGQLDMVKLLLEYEADCGFRNNAGQTPRDVAASREIKDLFALIDELHEDANVDQVLERLSEIEFAERRPLLNAVHPNGEQLWEVLAAKCTDKKKLLNVIGEQIEEDSKSQTELSRKLLGVMLEVNENKDKYFKC